MIRKLVIILLFLMAVVVSAQSGDTQNTTNVPSTIIKMRNITGDNLTLQGMNSSQSFWVALPPTWEIIDNIVLDIQYVSSELLQEVSSITVVVNDVVVKSFVPENDGLLHTVQIEFSSDIVAQGSGFLVEFLAYLRVTDDECELASLPSQWVSINGETSISVTPNTTLTEPTLEDIGEGMVYSTAFAPFQAILFILPSIPTVEELNAAMAVAMRLGQSNTAELPTILVRSPETVTAQELASSNIVVVGLVSDNNYVRQIVDNMDIFDSDIFISDDGTTIPDADGVIALANSPWNSHYLALVVSANSMIGIPTVSKAFTNNELYALLDGSYKFVSAIATNTPIAQPSLFSDSEITLAETGFDSVTAYGMGASTVFHSFQRPPGWQLQSGAQLDLRIGTSVLDQGSHVAVFMDDIFVGTVETMQGAAVTKLLPLPVDEINATWRNEPFSVSTLRFDIVNLLPFDQCQRTGQRDIWTRIEGESKLQLPHEMLDYPNIRLFPYPFVNSEVDTTITLALSPQPTQEEILQGLLLAMNLGQYKVLNVNLYISLSPTITSEMESGSLIVLGQPQSNPLIEAVIPDYFVISQEEVYEAIGTSNAGIIQEFPALWDENLLIMTIYGDQLESVQTAVQSLINYNEVENLITSETRETRLIRALEQPMDQ